MGGSGGGGAGQVDYPDYMKNFHVGVLSHGDGIDTFDHSLVEAINDAYDNSPFATAAAYDPDTDIAAMISSNDDFADLVTLLSSGSGINTLAANVLSNSRIDTAVDEFSADLADRFTSEVLPRFEGGMRDINAVSSSAFVIGRAILDASQTRQVSKYSSELHIKAFGEDALRLIALKLEYQRLSTHYTIEANRVKIVAKKEEAEVNLDIDEADSTWNLEIYQHAANMLAAIGGGVIPSNKKKSNKMASAIGGGISGAASGAMIGASYGEGAGPYGALIGFVVGAAAGYLMGE